MCCNRFTRKHRRIIAVHCRSRNLLLSHGRKSAQLHSAAHHRDPNKHSGSHWRHGRCRRNGSNGTGGCCWLCRWINRTGGSNGCHWRYRPGWSHWRWRHGSNRRGWSHWGDRTGWSNWPRRTARPRRHSGRYWIYWTGWGYRTHGSHWPKRSYGSVRSSRCNRPPRGNRSSGSARRDWANRPARHYRGNRNIGYGWSHWCHRPRRNRLLPDQRERFRGAWKWCE